MLLIVRIIYKDYKIQTITIPNVHNIRKLLFQQVNSNYIIPNMLLIK